MYLLPLISWGARSAASETVTGATSSITSAGTLVTTFNSGATCQRTMKLSGLKIEETLFIIYILLNTDFHQENNHCQVEKWRDSNEGENIL